MTTDTFGQITVSEGPDCAFVAFPYDKARTAALREAFPKARWLPTTKTWSVPGKLAYKRLVKWAADRDAEHAKEERARENERRSAEFEGRLHEVDPAAALALRRGEIKSQRVAVAGAQVSYDFRYSDEAVRIAKTMPGARYDSQGKLWRWTARTVADIDAIVAGCNAIRDIAAAQIAAEQARKDAAVAQAAAERAQRDAQMQHVRSHRYAERTASAPAVGETIRRWREIVTVESLGKIFRGGDDLSSLGGPIGAEGQWVRYVYFRAATADEIAALEAREAEQAAAAAIVKARRAAIAEIAASEDRPNLGAEPQGEIIWRDEKSAAVGYSSRVVLSADGWLYHVTTDRSDGAAWGDYNFGYCTWGARLPATGERIAAIRGEAK